MAKPGSRGRGVFGARWDRLKDGARNARDLFVQGQLAPTYQAAFESMGNAGIAQIRRYLHPTGRPGDGPAILLVPPLMVTADVYDIDPELSAVGFLLSAGIDVWLVDFGTPEDVEGGLERTLDDHILAVDSAIGKAAAVTGRAIHLAGYSQGGMFAYQTAAWRNDRDIASIITFGSPVDIWKNLPVRLHESVVERMVVGLRRLIDGPLATMEGLPASLTSRGFKLMSPVKEVQQLVRLVGQLHDREALERREPKRKFLGGGGFIAWPGPAFRKLVDDFVVSNRMLQGGFVIADRAVALADVRLPILTFVGSGDTMARPASVRAIRGAAPHADVHEVLLNAGHFGLVVGSKSLAITWPTVAEWMRWHDGEGEKPQRLQDEFIEAEAQAAAAAAVPPTAADALGDLARDVALRVVNDLGERAFSVIGVVDSFRIQAPRLARLATLRDDTRANMGRLLAEQAEAIPDATFFLWRGRAFTYAEADRRVTQVAAALVREGIAPGDRVGVLMVNHPDYLTVIMSLVRLGAIPIALNTDAIGEALAQAVASSSPTRIVTDTERAVRGASVANGHPVLVMGTRRSESDGATSELPEGAIDLEARLNQDDMTLPNGMQANPGQARELGLLMFTSGSTGLPKAARITHRRWVSMAYGAAAACEVRATDTIYCCLPLHHATGLLVACGAALAGGSRLALATRFSTTRFWDEVRRYGASIVFYVGEVTRYLVQAPPSPSERDHPVRLFVGNGMRPHIWQRLKARIGDIRVLEFYGATEGNAILANLRGTKVGSVGRPITPGSDVFLGRFDIANHAFIRDADGWVEETRDGEPGVLLGRVDGSRALGNFDGYLDPHATEKKLLRNAVEAGDVWFNTGDLLSRDADGDYWFVDRLGDTFRWKGENVSTELVERIADRAPFIAHCAAYGVAIEGREGRAGALAIVLNEGMKLDAKGLYTLMVANLPPSARPRFIRVITDGDLAMTSTFKVRKNLLRDEGVDPGRIDDMIYWYNTENECYAPLGLDGYAALVTGL